MKSRWDAANAFFGQNHELVKSVRNDCGGHYQLKTATFVIRDIMTNETVGAMEIDFGPMQDQVRMLLKFTIELAAPAFVLQKPADEGEQAFISRLFEMVYEGWLHVVKIMHVLTKIYLVPAFGL